MMPSKIVTQRTGHEEGAAGGILDWAERKPGLNLNELFDRLTLIKSWGEYPVPPTDSGNSLEFHYGLSDGTIVVDQTARNAPKDAPSIWVLRQRLSAATG